MKIHAISVIVLFVMVACDDQSHEQSSIKASSFQSYELLNGDTVNKIDTKGKKQGVWYEPNAMQSDAKKVNYDDGVRQ